jgi:propane monooxygenase reductase subunit
MPCLQVVYSVLEGAAPEADGETGTVTDAVSKRMPELEGFDAYLCGPPGIVDAARKLLVQRGVRPRNIYFDVFVPTGEQPPS